MQTVGISEQPFRLSTVLLSIICLGLSLFVVPTTSVIAQDDNPPAVDEEPNGQTEEESSGPKPSSNMLVWMFQALGVVYSIVFLLLSMTLVALIVANILAVRRDNICPVDLVEIVESSIAEGNPAGAAEAVRTDESFLGQTVTAGLGKIEKGYDRSLEAMQEIGEEETMKLEHRLSYLALIGNIAPMIGLLGTVQGMIAAFDVIARSDQTPKPADLAVGISTALFTTLVGLAIAIPAIAIYNLLRNRSQKLVLEVGNTCEELLEKFHDSVAG